MLCTPVPPVVGPVGGISQLTGEEDESVTLNFEITRATPAVLVENIRWIYSPDFSVVPSGNMNEDITNSTNRIMKSSFMFNADLLSLTITNIAQARERNEPTDSGRYFLIATNPAGTRYSYIDLLVEG